MAMGVPLWSDGYIRTVVVGIHAALNVRMTLSAFWNIAVECGKILCKERTPQAVIFQATESGCECHCLLPLQSTNEEMYTIRMLDFCRLKQVGMVVFIDRTN